MDLSGFSNISKDITNTFAKIKQIFEDPKSYEHEINDESNKNDTYNEHVQKAFVEILSKFKQIDDKCIEFVKENLKLIKSFIRQEVNQNILLIFMINHRKLQRSG